MAAGNVCGLSHKLTCCNSTTDIDVLVRAAGVAVGLGLLMVGSETDKIFFAYDSLNCRMASGVVWYRWHARDQR